MEQPISRRDILHGFGAFTAAAFVPGTAVAMEMLAAEAAGRPYYPPVLTGLRGNHEGSYEVAHQLARESKRDWGPVTEPDSGVYDLVVVGAGLSGLAAAHFYLQKRPKARVLLIDNHDDFGGHAKRNEFRIGCRTLLSYGGSQSLVSPSYYPEVPKAVLDDLNIDAVRLARAYDHGFFERHGLTAGIYFDSRNWGVDRIVRYELGGLRYLPLAESALGATDAVAQMPISEAARREFLRLLTTREDRVSMPDDRRQTYLYSISYRDFLERHLDIHEPEVFAVLQDMPVDLGAGIEAVTAGDAIDYAWLPGAVAAGLTGYAEDEPYIHHFPDGNASVARMLVRRMIPDTAPGSTAEDIVSAQFDYGKLDVAASQVRLRLNSTVVRVVHEGEPRSADQVAIDYVLGSHACRVRARHCVLACYNSIIPSLCPELPEDQRDALSMSVKSPILYTNVVLNNWHAWKNLGIGAVVAAGSYHTVAKLDFPVAYGGQTVADHPDEPMVVNMERFAHRNNEGFSPREQRRLGRYELLATPFETIERNVREQLAGMLSGGGFDPARDIAAITVNRWAHGYADGFEDLGDPLVGGGTDTSRPNEKGRQPFGRITIANSDAGASAMLESAVEQAYRAVEELA